MTKEKKAGQYTSVNVRTFYLEEIAKLIDEDPTFRFATKGGFVNDAVREKLEKHQRKKIIEKNDEEEKSIDPD